jgi:transcriptional regulator with XRE-family HTH domain
VQITVQNNNLGSIVKHARTARNLTQEQLAELLGIGARHLMAIENEGKHPSYDVLFRLIRILEISSDAIFYPDGKPNDTRFDYIVRLLARCSERDIRVVTCLVESIITNP